MIRSFPLLIGIFVSIASSSALAQKARQELGAESLIYVGTRTGENSQAKGIYLFRMRTSDDPNIPEFVKVTPLGLVAEADNPTYFEIDAKRKRLFCVNEVSNFGPGKSGAVSSYSLDPASGKITLINQQPSRGPNPCHLALDREGKHLLVASYEGGNVAILPIDADGKLGAATDVKQHAGNSIHPQRQTAPHPAGVAFSPDNRFAYVCDLGLDKIFIYHFDADQGKLSSSEPAFVATKPGAGPRHLAFGRDAKFAYVNNELNSTVTAFAFDASSGSLKELQSLSTVPEYFDGPNTAAEIAVNLSGKGLLVSNCGHQSIVLFHIEPTGTLTYVEDQSTYGASPRHFGMDSAGKHYVVANESSGNILILRAPENDRIKPAGNVIETPSPTCAKFLPK